MRFFSLALFLFFALSSTSWANLENENLLSKLPHGYKIDFQTKKGNMIIMEMVPQSESVKNWTEMLTVQIFLAMKNITPEQFQMSIQKS